MADRVGLLSLPVEILQYILLIASTPSFIQLSASCKTLYELSKTSRDIVLHHLRSVPGIKSGLDDPTMSTQDLFLLFRQRASKHLYGSNFHADCLELRTRNTSIDSDASCIMRNWSGHGRVSLVSKDSQLVRLYDNSYRLTEAKVSPFCEGKVAVLQVAHSQTFSAVLYQWETEDGPVTPSEIENPLISNHPYNKPNDLPFAVRSAMELEIDALIKTDLDDVKSREANPAKKFQIQFYNFNSMDTLQTFEVSQHKHLVPRHLALGSKLLWAILWDVEGSKLPTNECEIVQYNTRKWYLPDETKDHLESRVVWPTDFDLRPRAPGKDDIDKGTVVKCPVRIAFFKEGRRLRLYAPGDVVPFKVISMGSSRQGRLPTNSIYFENQTLFHVDTSFFGMHESWWDTDEAQQVCQISHLCLGVGNVWHGTGNCKVLCILLSSSKRDHDDCPHSVELNRTNHVTADNCKAVARLWGWSDMSSTLTGLDTVAVSPHGTRIAIAQWNRVLIWSVDPQMLCEEIVDFDSQDTKNAKRKKKNSQPDSVAEDFYQRVNDKLMGWKVANLMPIAIGLDGAIARKMSWTVTMEDDEDSSDNSSGDEDYTMTSQNTSSDKMKSQELETAMETRGSDPSAEDSDQETTIEAITSTVDIDPEQDHIVHGLGNKQATQMEMVFNVTDIDSHPLTDTEICNNPPSRVGPKRIIPTVSTHSSRPHAQEKQSRASKLDTEIDVMKHESQVESVQSIKEMTISTKTVATEMSVPTVVEVAPPTSNKSSRGPKGKEKEMDFDLDITSDELLQQFPSPQRPSKSDRRRKDRHPKRFTEDELVILTDRGLQVWNFGAWSRGLRTKRWLDEQHPFVPTIN